MVRGNTWYKTSELKFGDAEYAAELINVTTAGYTVYDRVSTNRIIPSDARKGKNAYRKGR